MNERADGPIEAAFVLKLRHLAARPGPDPLRRLHRPHPEAFSQSRGSSSPTEN